VGVAYANLLAEAGFVAKSTFALVPVFEGGGHVVVMSGELGDWRSW